MAEETFNFGIVESGMFGDSKAVDAFLSDTPLPADDKDLEEVDEEAEAQAKLEAKKKAKLEAAKKAAAAEAAAKKSVDKILFEEDDDEGKEEDDTPPEGEEDKVDEKAEEGNDYEILAKDLIKLGVFTQESENEPVPKTGAELLEKFNKEKETGAVQWLDSFLARHGEDRRDLFEAIFINGVDPREYLPVYSQVQNLESLDIAQEANQELVFREFYKRIKFPAEKIEIKLKKSKDNGDLEEEAKEFHQQIIAQDKEALKVQETSKAEKLVQDQKADSDYKANIGKVLSEKLKAKEFNGIPLTQELANKAYDFMYTKKYKTTDGQYLTEFDKFILESKRPENVETRALIALLKLTNFDFTKIAKRAVSNESNELFTTLAQRRAKKSETQEQKKTASSKSWINL